MPALFQGFQSLIENSPDAISLINQQGEILYGSASNTTLLGYRPDELIGRDCMELIHPEDRDHSSHLLQEVISKPGGPLRFDARVRRKDGNYCWVESTVSNLIRDLEVQAIVMHQRDIHDLMESRENGRRQAEELTRSNLRMEEFAYTVAHDLREPLRAISLYTQLLSANMQMDADTRQMAEFVIQGANRLSVMISDLLSFARTGMHRSPVLVDLASVVRQAAQNLTLEIQESGAILTIDELPTVSSDKTLLVSLFQNLLSNAMKYRSEKPLNIRVSAEPKGSSWIIVVKDNGQGIELEYQSRIFLPFIRLANRDVPGTGLGLAVCKKIVEGFGGTIWVESELGAGSRFTFTINAGITDADTSVPPMVS
jgi:PAS domain S-box-containing protein